MSGCIVYSLSYLLKENISFRNKWNMEKRFWDWIDSKFWIDVVKKLSLFKHIIKLDVQYRPTTLIEKKRRSRQGGKWVYQGTMPTKNLFNRISMGGPSNDRLSNWLTHPIKSIRFWIKMVPVLKRKKLQLFRSGFCT